MGKKGGKHWGERWCVGKIEIRPVECEKTRNVNCKYSEEKLPANAVIAEVGHTEREIEREGRSIEKEAGRLEKRLDQRRRRNSARSTKTKRQERK